MTRHLQTEEDAEGFAAAADETFVALERWAIARGLRRPAIHSRMPSENARDAEPATVLLVEDFLNAFNAIEAELKRRTGLDDHESVRTAAHRFEEANGWWRRDFEALLAFADLRNVIVHERFRRFAYLSVPSREVVDEIRAIRDRLVRPRTAGESFARRVAVVDVDEPLARLMGRVREGGFTQFPVYDEDRFVGLVTGSGVMRWLADELAESDHALMDFGERRVRELLAQEEARPNWRFAARDVPADEVAFAFTRNPQLEAVLITHTGREDQKLLGIATQSDVVAMVRGGEDD